MYIFIGGIPASGKTYLAGKVAEKTGALHFDLIHEDIADKPFGFNPVLIES